MTNPYLGDVKSNIDAEVLSNIIKKTEAGGVGEQVITMMANMPIYVQELGDERGNINNIDTTPEITQQAIQLWNNIAKIFKVGNNEIYKTIRLYDGSEKGDDSGENLPNSFIKEDQFVFGGEYFDYAFGKTVNILAPYYDEEKKSITEYGKGYRLIIEDKDVKKNSVIRYSVYALDDTDETNLPDDYEHRPIGQNFILVQQDGLFEIFCYYKSCIELRYGIWNGEVDVVLDKSKTISKDENSNVSSNDSTSESGTTNNVSNTTNVTDDVTGDVIKEVKLMPLTVSENKIKLEDMSAGSWNSVATGSDSMELIGVSYDALKSATNTIKIRFVIDGVTKFEAPLNAFMTVNVSANGSSAISHMPFWSGRVKSSVGVWSIDVYNSAHIASPSPIFVHVAHF